MPELTEQQAEQLHDWQMVLTDVRYALAQCKRANGLGCVSHDPLQRAVDALERIEGTAARNVKE